MPDIEQQVEHIIITKGKFYWGLIAAIVGACFAVGVPFFSIKQDVELIKQNHYTHIESLQKQVEELKQQDTDLEKKNKELLDLIILHNSKLDTIIGQMKEHLKN